MNTKYGNQFIKLKFDQSTLINHINHIPKLKFKIFSFDIVNNNKKEE